MSEHDSRRVQEYKKGTTVSTLSVVPTFSGYTLQCCFLFMKTFKTRWVSLMFEETAGERVT